MSKTVLSVGQCAADHGRISQLIQSNFAVTIETADDHESAINCARNRQYDLIMINRILDATDTEGSEIIRELKRDSNTKSTPVMLISNYADAQAAAVSLGAETGFGKAELDAEETVSRLSQFLG